MKYPEVSQVNVNINVIVCKQCFSKSSWTTEIKLQLILGTSENQSKEFWCVNPQLVRYSSRDAVDIKQLLSQCQETPELMASWFFSLLQYCHHGQKKDATPPQFNRPRKENPRNSQNRGLALSNYGYGQKNERIPINIEKGGQWWRSKLLSNTNHVGVDDFESSALVIRHMQSGHGKV